MGSQVVLGPEDGDLAAAGSPCRKYLWGTALPLDRDHSDLILLKQLLTGHQNLAVYSLLDDSWQRAHNFYNCYQQLKQDQLEREFADGHLASSPAAVLRAAQRLDVDMTPLVDEVCSSMCVFGGGQDKLQDNLRCEEQHRQEHQLRQAQADRDRYMQLAEERGDSLIKAEEQQRAAQAEAERLRAALAQMKDSREFWRMIAAVVFAIVVLLVMSALG